MRKALIIGIDNYPSHQLHCCVNDAQSISNQLRRNGDGSLNFDVMTKTYLASARDAKELIENLFRGDGHIALLYFAGHGYKSEYGNTIVFPDDCINNTSANIGLPLSEIIKMANKSNFRNKVIILDSCFSGEIGNIHSKLNDCCEIAQGVSILTACRKDETSEESGDHGLFTEQLCNALDGGAADFCGNITMGSIYAYIDRHFGAWQQRPTFKTNVTEFAPIKKVQPPIDIEIIRSLCTYFKEPHDVFLLDPSFEHTNIKGGPASKEPFANEANIKIFRDLQKLESIGFVLPTQAEFMYFAAMESKGCKLTRLGKYYWNLVKNNRI